ncbi:MAG: hypothetical protein ACF8SC_02385 [Phycisphaerales bacterium JB037]
MTNAFGGMHPGYCARCGHILQWGGLCANCSREAEQAERRAQRRRAQDRAAKKREKFEAEVKRIQAEEGPLRKALDSAIRKQADLSKLVHRGELKLKSIEAGYAKDVRRSERQIAALEGKLKAARTAASKLLGRRDAKIQPVRASLEASQRKLGEASKAVDRASEQLAAKQRKAAERIKQAERKHLH